MKVTGGKEVEKGTGEGTSPENQGLHGMGVLGGQAKGGREFMVDLMDVTVERTPVEGAVHPVVEKVLKDEEDGNLHDHGVPRGEDVNDAHANGLGKGVEAKHHRKLDETVGEGDEGKALSELRGSHLLTTLELILTEVGDTVNGIEGEEATKVDNFMHEEGDCGDDEHGVSTTVKETKP